MDLSIIIVSWQSRQGLAKNLKSLFLSEGNFKFEVIVVDNNSSDKTVEMIRNNFKKVKLIINKENLGFARANNQGIKQARGRYILLLNPDMKLFPETLKNCLAWADKNQQAVITGFRLLNKEGEIVPHVRRFPRFFDQLMIILKIPHLFPQVLNSYLMSNFDYNQATAVDSIRGSFFLINKATFYQISKQEKPYLDERYFVWFEEVDFCRFVQRLGGEVWYSPRASAIDYVGQSFAKIKRKKAQIYFRDSMLKYFSKWEKKWQKQILSFAWKIVFIFIR